MKRVIPVLLVFLFLVPVLACGASAQESYIFELMPDIEYLDDSFVFPTDGQVFWLEGDLPAGSYYVRAYCEFEDSGDVFFLDAKSVDSVLVSWSDDLSFIANDVSFSLDFFVNDEHQLAELRSFNILMSRTTDSVLLNLQLDGVTTGDDFQYVEFIPVDSSDPLSLFLADSVSVCASVLSGVGDVCSTIVSSPLILLTVGFLFIGGCIGIFGRSSDRH